MEGLGEGVDGFEHGEAVVINPGVAAPDGSIHVITLSPQSEQTITNVCSSAPARASAARTRSTQAST